MLQISQDMLEDFRLQVFLTVVDQKSFTKAAAKLKVSQPAVSQNIAELERLLDKKLFVRLKNETLLTPEGEVFLVYVNEIMSKCESLENMFCKIAPTTVRISASEELYAYLIGPAIDSFASIHPDVVFERCLSVMPTSLFSCALPAKRQLKQTAKRQLKQPAKRSPRSGCRSRRYKKRMTVRPSVKRHRVSMLSSSLQKLFHAQDCADS